MTKENLQPRSGIAGFKDDRVKDLFNRNDGVEKIMIGPAGFRDAIEDGKPKINIVFFIAPSI